MRKNRNYSLRRGAPDLAGSTQNIEKTEQKNKINLFSIHPGKIDTDLHETAFPEQIKQEAPYVIEHMEAIGKKRPRYTGGLPAWTCVWLCTGKDVDFSRGKYVDCTRDIEEQAAAAAAKKA